MIYNGAGGGGGGGSSGVPAGAAAVSGERLQQTSAGAKPSVTFSWTAPAPAVTTGAVTAGAPTATLTGTVNPNLSALTLCSFSISPAADGVSSLPCAQQVPLTGTPTPVSATATGLTAGASYTVALTAASAQGSTTGAPVTFTAGAGASGAPLSVGSLRLSQSRFRRGHRTATLAAAHPAGSTTVSFTLSAAASVKLTFAAATTGVSSRGGCRRAIAHRAGPRCTRYVPLPRSLTLAGHAGSDRITFDGVLEHGYLLPYGSYRLSLSAASGAAAAVARQHPSFTLLH